VTRLLKAELLKLRTTRTFWGLVGAALSLLTLILVLALAFSDFRTESDVRSALSTAGATGLMMLVLGTVYSAGEYRHGTIAFTLLVTPDRFIVATGQALASAAMGLAVGVAAALVTAIIGLPWLGAMDAPTPAAGEQLGLFAGGVLYSGLAGAFGAAIGAVLRNQVAAVVLVLVVLFVIDPTVAALVPDYAPYSLNGLGVAMSRGGAEALGGEEPLAFWQAALLWIAYTGVLVGAAALLTSRRDV
jgi:ABC-2 type transport system permease protein